MIAILILCPLLLLGLCAIAATVHGGRLEEHLRVEDQGQVYLLPARPLPTEPPVFTVYGSPLDTRQSR